MSTEFSCGVIAKPVIAYDFGGTIVEPYDRRGGYFAPYGKSLETIREFVGRLGAQSNYVVTKRAKPEYEQNFYDWINTHQFLQRTGLAETNLRTCRTVAEKIPIFTELGVNILVTNELRDLTGLDQTPVEIVLLFNAGAISPIRRASKPWVELIYWHDWQKVREALYTYTVRSKTKEQPTAAATASA